MFSSRFMPCADCGASLDLRSDLGHTCDPERLLDYRMFGLREETGAFVPQFVQFLDTPKGRFESWLAARRVRRTG